MTCPIWDGVPENEDLERRIFHSPRLNNARITLRPDALPELQGLGKWEKTRLSYWITEHYRLYKQPVRIDREQILAWFQSRPSIEERILSFMRELIDKSNQGRYNLWFQYGGYGQCSDQQIGIRDQQISRYWKSRKNLVPMHVAGHQALLYLLIVSDCIHEHSLHEFFVHARDKGWLELEVGPNGMGYACQIKLSARAFVEEKDRTRGQGRRGFMAMWFDCSMEEAWQNGFKPAIQKAGYEPYRVNEDHYAGLVYDKIIASIRQSRFVVADLTCNNVCDQDRARGNVYYEAGFAEGLNIPVILTCRHDSLANIHFDLKPHVTIVWRDTADLQKQLTLRIQRLLGQGPVPAPIKNEQDASDNVGKGKRKKRVPLRTVWLEAVRKRRDSALEWLFRRFASMLEVQTGLQRVDGSGPPSGMAYAHRSAPRYDPADQATAPP